jgi:ribosome recycling factor
MSDALDLNDLKRRMDGAIQALRHELNGLRTGRASASLLEPITVEAYGSQMPLNQVANITVPESRMLAVSVWDKSMVGKVERAIRESGLGLNPITDGNNLRIPLPELNEQRRKELDELKKLEKDGDISQDDNRILSDKVQKLTDDTIAEMDKVVAVKEAEIMQV